MKLIYGDAGRDDFVFQLWVIDLISRLFGIIGFKRHVLYGSVKILIVRLDLEWVSLFINVFFKY